MTYLFLWRGSALVIGSSIDSTPHSHFATQISYGIHGPFRARLGAAGEWRSTRAAIFGANQEHAIDCEGQALAHVFIDGARCDSTLDADFAGHPPFAAVGQAIRHASQLTPEQAYQALCAWCACIGMLAQAIPAQGKAGTEARISRAQAWIAAHPGAEPTGAQLADLVCLSASRFTHLFRQETGLSLSRYLLWTRLLHAIDAIAQGHNMTASAHQAGFADAAHMSRSFRAIFGIAPSELAKMTIAFKPGGGTAT